MDRKKDIPWWLIISMLVFFWPVGLVMMFVKIFGDGDGKQKQFNKRGGSLGRDFVDVSYTRSEDDIGARIKPGKHSGKTRRSKGRFLRNLGIGLSFVGGLTGVLTLIGAMLDGSWFSEALLLSSLVFLAIGAPGLGLTFWGQSILRKAQRHSRYTRLIGDSREVSLDRLAGAMGVDFEQVCSDLEKMLDSGSFEGYHVDIERRVLTRGHLETNVPPRSGKTEPAKETGAAKGIHPADRIHAINQNIRQEEVSRKITRLETLTRRIYNYTELYPQKDKLARSFKERYLPKTIKILESYSRFEHSGSSGENVRAAMKDVEAVLDVLIASFEKQLDMLYMDEALDITTDIDALESMLAGAGLGQSPFAMGQGE